MSDSPYTIIANSTAVWEQKIGTCGSEAEHCPGTTLTPSITLVSRTVVDGVRTVVVKRGLAGATAKHYSFSAAVQATIPFVSAVGWSDTFEQHKVSPFAVNWSAEPTSHCTMLRRTPMQNRVLVY